MPLACHEGEVAGIAEELGEGNDAVVEVAFVSRHAALGPGVEGCALPGFVGPFDEVTQTGDVVVGACHYHGSGWGTCSGCM